MAGASIPNEAHEKTKALRGKALLAACLLDVDEEDEDFDDLHFDGEDVPVLRDEIPGCLPESPSSSERERRKRARRSKENSSNDTLEGRGSKRLGPRSRSRKHMVPEADQGSQSQTELKTRALKGAALLQACMLDSSESEDDNVEKD